MLTFKDTCYVAMLDIEGLGLCTNSAVVQIGFGWLNLVSGNIVSTSIAVNPEEVTGIIDADTVAWWIGQVAESPPLAKTVFGGNHTEAEALEILGNAYREIPAQRPWAVPVFANGAPFDFPILRSMASRAGVSVPWGFRQECCMRTLRHMYGDGYWPDHEPGRKHDARYDVEQQLGYIQNLVEDLREAA